ncbi:hypothetical protein BC936DRAFT_145326 [Jimgerdemannia flammicorona]|uniref:Geranylgeranyl transferase type II subunit alpha n=1 Tax=Jimgerdemannia flammicorona TaxID=994334 RepID=A0A433DA90_9FUNG|nr:hypothetical protein BC936DRAFT_145326 [Jimgerdemannia flammicorona]
MCWIFGVWTSLKAPLIAYRIEIELIKAAVYTDPDDSSVWLYRWWLIGRGTYFSLAAPSSSMFKARHADAQ